MVLPSFNDARGQYSVLREKVDSLPFLQRARIRTIRFREQLDKSRLMGNARFRLLAAFVTLAFVWLLAAGISKTPPAPPAPAVPPAPPPPPPPPKPVLPPMPMIEIADLLRETKSLAADAPGPYANGTYFESDRAAVIIEDRPLENLIPLILHYSAVLGPAWPVILYTSMPTIQNSSSLRRSLEEKRILIRSLPAGLKFETHFDVTKFLTQPWFWEQLAPAKNVLLFQADAMICGNAHLRVDDFMDYDLVGAPIQEEKWHGQGYNGGLSLRNRQLILDIIATDVALHPLDPEAPSDTDRYEDQWYFMRMRERGANLPIEDVAKTFAVQTLYYEFPIGYHQPEKFQAENMTLIEEWCPEVKLVTNKLLKCEPPIC
ncbi:hypothetical protein V500_10935 [Pseudogymnoascus sp. VKM F-4518 (FW-2643)]|nr:hypothetical protein V500_10935 [Pseudogymnoascus sp. VKM F-4518 (FW-2643)]